MLTMKLPLFLNVMGKIWSMLEMRIKNRPGYKICPHCKIEYERNADNFAIIKKTGRINGLCKKCQSKKNGIRCRTIGTDAICATCRGIYLSPKYHYSNRERKFCSKVCFNVFRSRDAEALLSMRGLQDLNDYRVINQKEY